MVVVRNIHKSILLISSALLLQRGVFIPLLPNRKGCIAYGYFPLPILIDYRALCRPSALFASVGFPTYKVYGFHTATFRRFPSRIQSEVSPHLSVVKMPIVEPIEAWQSKVYRAGWGFPNGMAEP